MPAQVMEPPRRSFLEELNSRTPLTPSELRTLKLSHVTSAEQLLALMWNFPSLGLDAPKLSNAAAPSAAALVSVMSEAGLDAQTPPSVALGVDAPLDVRHPIGYELQPKDLDPEAGAVAPAEHGDETAVDKRAAMPAWPVRDQGHRGTCVAFAMTALREHWEFTVNGGPVDLSEQFLFWATKTRTADPRPQRDGTWIEFAVDALGKIGVCAEPDWPYNGTPIPGNVAHDELGHPTPSALSTASGFAETATLYQRGAASGNAATVLTALKNCRPVAVSLPVFADPLKPAGNNWNSPLGTLYGRVLDPPPTSIVIGGHAVCVTGYQPDAAEPSGGYFVFRNSWGGTWGRQLPVAGYAGPEKGYGEVSATYVERFLWECAQL